jgi:hypothetical protein
LRTQINDLISARQTRWLIADTRAWLASAIKLRNSSPMWGLRPRPPVCKTGALPLSYRGTARPEVPDTLFDSIWASSMLSNKKTRSVFVLQISSFVSRCEKQKRYERPAGTPIRRPTRAHRCSGSMDHIDPGRTRTCNPRLRGPMPYPLGHGATWCPTKLKRVQRIWAIKQKLLINLQPSASKKKVLSLLAQRGCLV